MIRRLLLSTRILIIPYLIAYVVAGLDTQEGLKQKASALQDLRYYERAVNDTFQGVGPYSVLAIGPGFLYPPPSLLIIEPIKAIHDEGMKQRIVMSLNYLIIATMVWGLIGYFKLSHREVWYWYILGLWFAPFLESAYLGQINVVPLAGLSLFFLFLTRRPLIAGAGLAIATFSKVSPGLFFLYALLTRRWRACAAAAMSSLILCSLAALRYGVTPFLEYPKLLAWLSTQVTLGTNPQSFEARIVWLQQVTAAQPEYFWWLSPFVLFCQDIFLHQRGLNWYLCGVILLSGILLFRSNNERHPSFVIFMLAMILAPNVMWYHHYTLMLLPLLIWMGHSQLSPRVVCWCLLGLFIMQIDRWQLTHGFLIHLFGHLSIITLLTQQVRRCILPSKLAKA